MEIVFIIICSSTVTLYLFFIILTSVQMFLVAIFAKYITHSVCLFVFKVVCLSVTPKLLHGW